MLPTSSKEITSSLPVRQHCHVFPIAEIQSATQNFNESLVIGRGGFGKVYIGTIIYNGTRTDVAIKRRDSSSNQGGIEFRTEVEILSVLRHRNIVNLFGCYNDDKEMILVYEYMSNGDLGSHLHKHHTPFSWTQRLKIGIDVARALDYLHNGTNGQGIIHSDPKCSNIMLDNQWRAKITDFGISKIIPVDSPTTHVSVSVQGTFGYADPDYIQTGRLSKKSDVYTLGVVLLEVLCRKPALDSSVDGEPRILVLWALDYVKKRKLKKVIDPELRGQVSLKCLNDYVKIAQGCLHKRPENRITMAEVVVGLESILSLHQKTDKSIPQMGRITSDKSSRGSYIRKAAKFLSPESRQHKEDDGYMSGSLSEIDVLSEASYQLDTSLKHTTPFSNEEFDTTSHIQRATLLNRRKDFLHLIWFYPMKKEAEINFGSLVAKFSTLNKYIRKSKDSSIRENYLMQIQTLFLDVEEHLDDAAFDMVAYLPEGFIQNGPWSVEFETIATGANSVQLPNASFWSGIPEIHASTIASARNRALRCIKDLKVKKLGISGIGAEEVATSLKDMVELTSAFDIVLFVCVKNPNVEALMNDIEDKIYLWKNKNSETGNKINVLDPFLNCLLFVDCSDEFIDLHEPEFHLSTWFQSVQIVMTSGRKNGAYFPVDLEIRIQDHLLPWMLFSSNLDLTTVGNYSSIKQMAARMVEECDGHLLAIILLARALSGVVNVSVWELALQELASQSQLGVMVMVRVLRFILSRLNTVSQRCIIQSALCYKGAKLTKFELISNWFRDGFLKSEREGEYVFKELIRSFLLEQVEESFVRMRDEIRVILVAHFVPRAYGLYLKQDGSKSNKIPKIEEWDAREIHLVKNILSELPENPNCPILKELVLNSNQDLSDIPVTFFDNMPTLKVLDLSSTSIKCLPSTVCKLTTLQELFIRNCDLIMELPPEIGALENLKVFDSEGTQLICLPQQFGSLTKLESLKFSLYNLADRYKRSNQNMQIIPASDLSKLKRLKELSICVDSYGEWWEDEVKFIINILAKLRDLESLRLYIPTTEMFRKFMFTQNWEGVPIYQHLSNFGFTVGHLQQRLISRLPFDLDERFIKQPKCLKFTNTEGNTEVIAKALKHANALFLDRHWTIQSLSTFGLSEIEKLKLCCLSECNEMLEIFNGKDFFLGPVLGSLEYLSVHYMKSLTCIWNGPIHSASLSKLKVLVMHACPELRTILTYGLLDNLTCLEYLIIEDCPKINSLISLGPYDSTSTCILPSLKNISLLYLPELVSIFDGKSIAPRLESLVVYDCPNLEKLSFREISHHIKEIKGEIEWWDGLKWCEPDWVDGQPPYYLASVFIPLGIDGDIMDELAQAVKSLPPTFK